MVVLPTKKLNKSPSPTPIFCYPNKITKFSTNKHLKDKFHWLSWLLQIQRRIRQARRRKGRKKWETRFQLRTSKV
jgi:hypothetical protein